MRQTSFPEPKDLLLTDVLYALSDATRMHIVRRLAEEGELPCGESSAPTPKSTLSHHLRVLRENGIIATRAEGTYSINSLRRADLDARFPGLLDAILHNCSSGAVMDPDASKEASA